MFFLIEIALKKKKKILNRFWEFRELEEKEK